MPVGYIYSRNDIVTAATIQASHFTAEFNDITSSMHAATGHNHDGTAGGGASISLTTSTTGILPITKGGTGSITAADARTALGLGTIATQAANAVAITGGSVTGITDITVADGGTGASNQTDARTNLGLGSIATQNASSVSITGGSVTGITDITVSDGGTGASNQTDARTNLGLGSIATQNASSVSITGGSLTGITDITVVANGTGVSSPIFKATSSTGGILQNASGTSQMQWGSSGGNNLSLEVATTINPANAAVSISPTGTGTVAISPAGALTINPTTASTMDNVAIGQTTAASAKVTTLNITSTLALANSTGTSGYVLTSNGASAPTWSASGITITNDTTTNATRYLTFSDLTTGTETTFDVSSTKLTFNPSTGALTATTLTPTNALAIANGGTGQTSASAALSSLGGINTGKAIAMSLVFG